MTDLPFSVVIVSRDRPDALKRCLMGVSQLQEARFEIIVVADPAGIEAAMSMPFSEALKLVPYDEPNISAARNLGVTAAAGDVVAFIDDDAVPETLWLKHLRGPAERGVAAMGGYVRARNGISYQWTARSLDAHGLAAPLDIDPVRPTILTPPSGRAVKTEGTNMAIRREVLIELGGFDTAFRYYLDETDLNMRLAQAGHATALVPLAEVHHGFAANRVRTAARVPRDLFEIGASWAVFQRKHISKHAHRDHWAARRNHEKRRLLDHMVKGNLEPGNVAPMLQRLELGYGEGQSRRLGRTELPKHPSEAFKPFPTAHKPRVLVSGRGFGGRALHEDAQDRAGRGDIVTLMVFSPTALFHTVRYRAEGYWEHRGGVFGKSERNQPLFRISTLKRRIRAEVERIAPQRGKFADTTRKRNN